PIQILDSRSALVSPIIPPTLFNISSTPPNISLLTSTADHWSSVAVNRDIEQSSSSSSTLLYPQLDISNNFFPKFSSISILTQYIVPLSPLVLSTTYQLLIIILEFHIKQILNNSHYIHNLTKLFGIPFIQIINNTETQYTSIYPNISDTKETTQTLLNNQSDLDSEQSFEKVFTAILDQNINRLTLPNDPGEGLSNSFIVTTKVLTQPIEDIKEKQPQYDTKMSIESNKTSQQIVECLEARS
ncbi:22598_t:CDS:2, partial [Gigaspora margarita]